MFCLTVHCFFARVESPTCTTYGKVLLKSIMAVLTLKSSIDRKVNGARIKSKHNYINIKTTDPFSNFLSFHSRVFIFFMFCISSNKLNSISCGICLSFKSRHLELFCKIIIQLFSTGIFLVLCSRSPPCNFTERLFFLHSCEWLLPII